MVQVGLCRGPGVCNGRVLWINLLCWSLYLVFCLIGALVCCVCLCYSLLSYVAVVCNDLRPVTTLPPICPTPPTFHPVQILLSLAFGGWFFLDFGWCFCATRRSGVTSPLFSQ